MASDISTYRVKDAMSSVVISVGPDDTIHEALVLMAQYRVTVLPVTDGRDRCMGILSTSDLIDPTRELEEELHDVERVSDQFRQWIIEKLTQANMGQQKVRELMTGSVAAVDRETPIQEATGEMLRHRVHHLPVVDENRKLLGIVSTIDMLSVFHRCCAAD
ncbi:MAG: CBS domain-containing protein [Candidatus Tectomicrobia bacterium]|nr:CBS domain-containing protein [Candidatus Tectomicrobia bacterium]